MLQLVYDYLTVNRSMWIRAQPASMLPEFVLTAEDALLSTESTLYTSIPDHGEWSPYISLSYLQLNRKIYIVQDTLKQEEHLSLKLDQNSIIFISKIISAYGYTTGSTVCLPEVPYTVLCWMTLSSPLLSEISCYALLLLKLMQILRETEQCIRILTTGLEMCLDYS